MRYIGNKFVMSNPVKKQGNVKNNISNEPFNFSLHSNEIKDNLDKINMDPWYYIYENYVNPDSKKPKDK